MKASEVIQVLKSSIAATRGSGADQVSLADLDAYTERLEETAMQTPEGTAAGDAAMEAYRADLAAWISSRQQRHELDLQMLRAVITTGQSGLKSSVLINGGAAVALLGFIGGIWPKVESPSILEALATSLIHFVFGVLSAAVATGFTYLSQAGYANEFGRSSRFIGRAGHIIAVLGVLCAYVLFGRGAWLAYLAVGNG
jgi:hypothetical protein